MLGHGAFHRVEQRYVFDFHGCDLDAPRIGLPMDDLLQDEIDSFAVCEQLVLARDGCAVRQKKAYPVYDDD